LGVSQIAAWTEVLASTGSTHSAPTLASHGVALDKRMRGVPVHLVVNKANTATVTVYGYAMAQTTWYALETFSWGGDSLAHAEPLEYAGAFDRLYCHVSALGGGNIDIALGEVDGERY